MSLQPYSAFVQQSLYGPGGYYTTPRTRVGRFASADFYTSSSVPLFSRLLATAFATLSQLHRLASPALIELGNEPNHPLFSVPPTGFSSVKAFPLGTLTPPAAASFPSPGVIFSNELFDALAFDRFRLQDDGWHLLGLDPDQKLLDLDLGALPTPASPAPLALLRSLGSDFPLGATLDLSAHALSLLDILCAPAWHGLFIIFDYGLTLAELSARPRPTARAYRAHQALSLVEALQLPPATYDITHHVCWDLLAERLRAHGFSVQPVLTQEAFFVNYAAALFPSLTPADRRSLSTLVHPAHLGQSFQVLIARR